MNIWRHHVLHHSWLWRRRSSWLLLLLCIQRVYWSATACSLWRLLRAVISSPPPPIGFCRRTLRATTLRTGSTFAFTQLLPPWRPTLSLELCSCTSGRTGKCTFERPRRPSCLPLKHCKELFIFYFVSCSFYFKMIPEFFWSLFHKNVLVIFLNSYLNTGVCFDLNQIFISSVLSLTEKRFCSSLSPVKQFTH